MLIVTFLNAVAIVYM